MTEKSFGHGKVHNHHVRGVGTYHIISAECEDFKKCWALSNLYPLWAEDHRALHSRLDPELDALMLTKPTEVQIEKLCRKHLRYTLKHSLHTC